ncbi:MAG: HDIG domain-containing protein [Gemmatimonadetes bacterium]|nr:HDIG domain-containing protein [Gemmatimonadota bacterium]
MKGIFERRPEAPGGPPPTALNARPLWSELWPRIATFIGLSLLTILLFPARSIGPAPQVRAGMIASEDVIAPFDVAIPKTPAELERDRATAALAVPRVYRSVTPEDSATGIVDEYLAKVERIAAAPRPERGAGVSLLTSEIDSYGGQRIGLADTEIEALQEPAFRDSVGAQLRRAISAVHADGWVAAPALLDEIQGGQVTLLRDSAEVMVLRRDLRRPDAALESPVWREALSDASPRARSVVGKLGRVLLPSNLVFLPLETEARREKARAAVPARKGDVLAGELIVGAHMRVTLAQAEQLDALRAEIERRRRTVTAEELKPLVGHLLLSTIVLGLLFLYMYLYRPDIFDSLSSFLLLALGLALLLGLSSVIYRIQALPVFLLPAGFLTILLAILFDGRFALVVSFVVAILLFGQGDFGPEGLVVVLLGGVGGALSVRVLRQRHQFYETMLVVAAANLLAVVTLSLMYLWPLRETVGALGWSLLNALLSGLLAMGLLPLFETVFKKTTDVTLLELSDLNRPLLKKMALEAPGTYHHSIMVGNLAEAAAEGIGANSLRARVGCYYHDIGKLRKPAYFAENQRPGMNPHDGLKPRMSALIIINHVKEGIEMAREAKLPSGVVDFIREHHGTSTIAFFVEKARRLDPSAEINLADYSYPGPRPRTKETAIAMLADNIEAISRVLVDPTPSRVRNLVERLVKRKIEERQLDDANLTFRELAIIQDKFANLLLGIFHARPEYPTFAVNVEADDAPLETHAADRLPPLAEPAP